MQVTCWFWQPRPQQDGVAHSRPSALVALQLEKPGLHVSTPPWHAPLSGLQFEASGGASIVLPASDASELVDVSDDASMLASMGETSLDASVKAPPLPPVEAPAFPLAPPDPPDPPLAPAAPPAMMVPAVPPP